MANIKTPSRTKAKTNAKAGPKANGKTKTLPPRDKVKPAALGAIYEAVMVETAKHPAAHPAIFTTSSETGSGIAELRTAILEAATV